MSAAAKPFMPQGTVYGVLLNFRGEVQALAPQMDQPPYKAPPKAPVLYVKTANTWSTEGAPIAVPPGIAEVETGATIAMIMGAPVSTDQAPAAIDFVAYFVLMNDLSVPHTSFFRPPVKYKCLDGFLGVGSQPVSAAEAGDPAKFTLEVRINDIVKQSVNFAHLVRNAAQLLSDVNEFMTLRPGDVLMLGCDVGRPLAKVGDRIAISAPGFGTLSNTLVANGSAAAPAASRDLL